MSFNILPIWVFVNINIVTIYLNANTHHDGGPPPPLVRAH